MCTHRFLFSESQPSLEPPHGEFYHLIILHVHVAMVVGLLLQHPVCGIQDRNEQSHDADKGQGYIREYEELCKRLVELEHVVKVIESAPDQDYHAEEGLADRQECPGHWSIPLKSK